MPVAIFYQDEPHPEGSNYFGIYFDPLRESYMITDGISAVTYQSGEREGEPVIYSCGLNEETKEAIYSAYRHDYQTHNGVIMMDGGRDYCRGNLSQGLLRFKIVDGELEIVVD